MPEMEPYHPGSLSYNRSQASKYGIAESKRGRIPTCSGCVNTSNWECSTQCIAAYLTSGVILGLGNYGMSWLGKDMEA